MDLPTTPGGCFWLERLKPIFAAIDAAYDRAAAAAGFHCAGCEDNCCLTHFHHHTLLEYYCLKEGLEALAADTRRRIGKRAEDVCRKPAEIEARGQAPRRLCPLNVDNRCIVYAHRPMICRMHGIPHELRQPGGKVMRGPGCEAYSIRCNPENRVFLDRTPFYRDMAALEGELRRATRFSGRIRMTVAQMVRQICGAAEGETAANPLGSDDEIL
jgi:Fe-S-cluster containining protein